jgi:hypothetical protein
LAALRLRLSKLASKIKDSDRLVDSAIMRTFATLILGLALAAFAAAGLRGGSPGGVFDLPGVVRDVASQAQIRESASVIFVRGRGRVAAVRAAVDDSRVVAETGGGFATRGGRVFAVDHRAANEVLARAGWADREIRIGASPRPAGEHDDSGALRGRWLPYALWAVVALAAWIVLRSAASLRTEVRLFLRERRGGSPDGHETVLLLGVNSVDDVAAVRAALPPERILAATPQGLVLAGGWIVSAGGSVASELVRKVGWCQRILEPLYPDPFTGDFGLGSFAAAGLELDGYAIESGGADHKGTWTAEAAVAVLRSDADPRDAAQP